MGDANPEQGAEVFEQASYACYSSLGGTFEAPPFKSLILFTFNPLRDATEIPLFQWVKTFCYQLCYHFKALAAVLGNSVTFG